MSARLRVFARAWPFAFLLVGGALIVWALARQSVVTCEVCVRFEGRRECASARAPTEDDARAAAHRNACGRITRSMTREIACQDTPPSQHQCNAPAR